MNPPGSKMQSSMKVPPLSLGLSPQGPRPQSIKQQNGNPPSAQQPHHSTALFNLVSIQSSYNSSKNHRIPTKILQQILRPKQLTTLRPAKILHPTRAHQPSQSRLLPCSDDPILADQFPKFHSADYVKREEFVPESVGEHSGEWTPGEC